jgi:hypothetical protein
MTRIKLIKTDSHFLVVENISPMIKLNKNPCKSVISASSVFYFQAKWEN